MPDTTDPTETRFVDLVHGYERFKSGDYRRQRELWERLAETQQPKVMVVACADSRVDPAQIFDTAPGEIFVVRNVAALVPPCETGGGHHGVSAALEFAVTKLEVEEVVVLGHGACGGCAAALSGAFEDAEPGHGGFIGDWVDLLDEARDRVRARCEDITGEAAHTEMEKEGVRVSLANLTTFPFVKERLDDGRLTLHGAHFAIKTGELSVLGADGAFRPVED